VPTAPGVPIGCVPPAGFCFIGGACVPSGTADPNDPCRICDAATNPYGYTAPAPVGTPCQVLNPCIAAAACDGAGRCATTAYADGLACLDDGNDCTIDICLGGACNRPLADGTTCPDPFDDECTLDICRGGSCRHECFEGPGCPCSS
jgi:hypothetical protein